MIDAQSAEQLSDSDLVAQTLADANCFARLMERYEAKLLRYIRRISNVRAEDAEDMLQEVFLKAYRNLRDFDQSLSFSSWIYRITRNHVISTHRKKEARPQTVQVEDKTLQNIADDLDIIKDIDLAYMKDHLGEALAGIDTKYREVLVLKFLEEKSYDEISDILKKPSGTIGTLINRAKKKLAKELDQSYVR